jgi:VWFA-related protein
MILVPMLGSAMSYAAFGQADDLSPAATFRTSTAEVHITFSTTDQNDRVMATVQPSDFAIVDRDLVVREFRSFTRSEYTRMKIALLVDSSGSVTPQFRKEVASVLQVISETSGVPEEDVSVISFRDLKPAVVCAGNCRTLNENQNKNQNVNQNANYASDPNANPVFLTMKNGGLTPLYDSAVFASRFLAKQRDDAKSDGGRVRRILILFSDGVDTISLSSFSDVVQEALLDDIIIYTVGVGRSQSFNGVQVLRSLALKTGGRYFPIEAGSSKITDAILEDFHATYTVAYKLPYYTAGFHEVRILPTHNLGLQFHCRLGYYFSGQR